MHRAAPLAVTALFLAPLALAETTAEDVPVVSAEELAEIEAATGADARGVTQADAAPAAPVPPIATAAPLSTALSAAIMNPDISVVGDFALAWFSADEPLQTGGHDPGKNGLHLQQLELGFSKAVDPYFRFDSFIVLSQFGIEIEEAYATTLALPGRLQLRAGQFLTRFGRINATHVHSWDFVDQPFAIGRIFGGEGNRGLGAELSWLLPLPWFCELVYSMTEAGGAATARSFFGGGGADVVTPLDFQSTLAAKQFFELSPDLSLLFGLSYANGPNPTGYRNRSEVFGTDLYLKWRPITRFSQQWVALQSEWMHRRRQLPGAVKQDVNGYAQLVWRYALRWAVAGRYEYGSAMWDGDFERVADDLDPFWTAGRQRVSANLTYWPTEFSRVRLQGATDLRGWQEQAEFSMMLAFEIVVGAHGAHKF